MQLLDHDEPLDPDIADTLDAIDAVIAGEPVDARYAELAEIALLVAAERPEVPPQFARSMDQRVVQRFGSAPGTAGAGSVRRRRGFWLSRGFWEASGALAAGVALIAAFVVVVGSIHGGSSANSSSAASFSTTSAASSAATAGSAAAGSSSGTAGPAAAASSARSARHSSASVPPSALTSTLQPPTTGRKVVQGAQLYLSAPPNRIEDVAQQVYDVVGAISGIVESSTVTQTGGPTGYADFQLSIPSGSLALTMSRLSSLNYAQVVSRTDTSQDITDQYGAAQRALADARALRTSLLKQLANAATTEQVDSLNAQLHDAEASISSDEATLARLNHSVGFSEVSVEIAARQAPAPVPQRSGGFGIGRAAHDAGRVLTVAAGVALIAIAGLAPVALVVALIWWVGSAITRRRREQALDAA